MARRACTFKQRDLTAALRATRAAGLDVHRVLVDREGKIEVIVAGEDDDGTNEKASNEWEIT